ncbi:hypothetical protein B7P43_G11640, partial [Cryptotermes secundus]
VKKVYFAYFKLKLGNQDKPWAPHKVCRRCEEDLHLWFKGKKNSFRFGIPMMWREQRNLTTDCYFCSVDAKGFNTKSKTHWPLRDALIPGEKNVINTTLVPPEKIFYYHLFILN